MEPRPDHREPDHGTGGPVAPPVPKTGDTYIPTGRKYVSCFYRPSFTSSKVCRWKIEGTRDQRLRSGASCSGLQSEGELSLLAQLSH